MLIFFCYRVTRQTFGIKIALADRDKRADTVADATRPHDPTQEDFPAAGTRGGFPPAPQGPAWPRPAADAPAGCQGCDVGTWLHRAAAAGHGERSGQGHRGGLSPRWAMPRPHGTSVPVIAWLWFCRTANRCVGPVTLC